MQQWFAQAPSNIALIKYMGKVDEQQNTPMNPSLSYTLSNLLTNVMLESHEGTKDFWEALQIPGALTFTLSPQAQVRFICHLDYIKRYFGYTGAFVVRSSNNFPLGSGLASSASSFAALTKCAVSALSELTGKPLPSIEEQAALSRVGSGSSCRSFFSPWALWDKTEVGSVELPYAHLLHQVVVISHAEKTVLSSAAHLRIRTSALYATRAERAKQNLRTLLDALRAGNWSAAYHVCWSEFHDMHQLFSTSQPAFRYITPEGEVVLGAVQALWDREGDGPIVTMDAGPNIHLLYREDQADTARKFKQDFLIGNHDVL